jgi:hypothetical protein
MAKKAKKAPNQTKRSRVGDVTFTATKEEGGGLEAGARVRVKSNRASGVLVRKTKEGAWVVKLEPKGTELRVAEANLERL